MDAHTQFATTRSGALGWRGRVTTHWPRVGLLLAGAAGLLSPMGPESATPVAATQYWHFLTEMLGDWSGLVSAVGEPFVVLFTCISAVSLIWPLTSLAVAALVRATRWVRFSSVVIALICVSKPIMHIALYWSGAPDIQVTGVLGLLGISPLQPTLVLDAVIWPTAAAVFALALVVRPWAGTQELDIKRQEPLMTVPRPEDPSGDSTSAAQNAHASETRFCTSCGAEAELTNAFCGRCGASLPQTQSEQQAVTPVAESTPRHVRAALRRPTRKQLVIGIGLALIIVAVLFSRQGNSVSSDAGSIEDFAAEIGCTNPVANSYPQWTIYFCNSDTQNFVILFDSEGAKQVFLSQGYSGTGFRVLGSNWLVNTYSSSIAQKAVDAGGQMIN